MGLLLKREYSQKFTKAQKSGWLRSLFQFWTSRSWLCQHWWRSGIQIYLLNGSDTHVTKEPSYIAMMPRKEKRKDDSDLKTLLYLHPWAASYILLHHGSFSWPQSLAFYCRQQQKGCNCVKLGVTEEAEIRQLERPEGCQREIFAPDCRFPIRSFSLSLSLSLSLSHLLLLLFSRPRTRCFLSFLPWEFGRLYQERAKL